MSDLFPPCPFAIHQITSPILEAYRSAIAFASKPDFLQKVVTREEYNESGSNACRRKFPDWKPKDGEASLTKGKGRARVTEEVPTPSKRGAPGRGTRGRGRGAGAPRRRAPRGRLED